MKLARISLVWAAIVLVAASTASAAPALGPVETLQSIQKAVAAEPPQLEVFWTSLPKTYQNQIRGLITEFASKTDADLWNASFRVLAKSAKVAREKGEFIRQSPLFAEVAGGKTSTGANAPFFTEERNWDSLITVVETIATSDISTHRGLKTLDPGKFLATTGTKIAKACIELAQAAGGEAAQGEFEKFTSGTFTLVSEEDETAVVKFEVEGEDDEEIRLAKVDDKWVFAELAGDFSQQFSQAKAQIGQISVTAEQKKQCLGLLKAIEGGLDELLAADSQETFNTTTERLAGELQVQFAGVAASFMEGFGNNVPPDVTIPGAKDESSEDSDDDSSEE
jgi:hypothetical protein